MLAVNNVSMHFGGLVALNEVSMTVKDGEIRGLIGPNGSGKTTMINVITGFYSPTKGTVEMDGQVISGKTPNAVAKAGLCRTFQNINLFSEMTALENVVTAASTHQTANLASAVFKTKALKDQEKQCYDRARELLDFVGLAGKEEIKATNLPYGQQRLLEIARALATDPKLLLLDEPVAGMNEQESDEAANLVHKLRENGKTILLIEHHMKFVMSLCDTLTVLNYGKVIAEGTPSEIQNNEDVISIYLGKKGGNNMLSIEHLSCHYGVIQALNDVTINIEKKGIYAIIGANGAGKSSLINVLSGLVPASSGKVVFEGKEITDLQPHEIIKTGISVCPEGRKIFKSVSVYENLLAGAYTLKDKGEIQKNVEMVYEFFPRLSERRKQLAGTLSGGEQQMLAIGRALMSNPRLLLLDEPSMGLAPNLIDFVFDTVVKIYEETELPSIIVEQNSEMALSIADYAYVLEVGHLTMEGTGEELLASDEVQKKYLGA